MIPTILVIGDIIIDRYIRGTSTRLSPEAPVPVIDISTEYVTHSLGGAGNVAANIAALGGTVRLVGVVGYPEPDLPVFDLMTDIYTGGVYRATDRPTSRKTRIIANNQQVARLDREVSYDADTTAQSVITHCVDCYAKDSQAIVVSDYAKGVITPFTMTNICRIAGERKLPLFVDPKVRHKEYYKSKHITAMTPNVHEVVGLSASSIQNSNANTLARNILAYYSHEYLLVTEGDKGMSLYGNLRWSVERSEYESDVQHIHTEARNVFDV